MSTIDRMNTLVQESTGTAFDTVTLVQEQYTQMFQTWLNVLEASRRPARELTLTAVKQAQAAQSLWFDLAQETFRTGVDNWVNLSETQLKEASENLDKVNRQVHVNSKQAEPVA